MIKRTIHTITDEDLDTYLKNVERAKSGAIANHMDRICKELLDSNRDIRREMLALKIENHTLKTTIRELQERLSEPEDIPSKPDLRIVRNDE